MAVLLNLLAAVGAFRILNIEGRKPRLDPPPVAQDKHTARDVHNRRFGLVLLAIALSGFAAMGMEIVWIRFLTSAVGHLRSVYSILLMVILVGIWTGSVGGGYFARFFRRPADLYILSQLLFALTCLTAFLVFNEHGLYTFDTPPDPLRLSAFSGTLVNIWVILHPTLVLIFVPSVLMGFAFPLANAIVQTSEHKVGRRAGILYLANTLGALGGSLLSGFVLLPLLGLKWSIAALLTVALLVTIPLLLLSRFQTRTTETGSRLRKPAFVVVSLMVLAGLTQWFLLPSNELLHTGSWTRKGKSLFEGSRVVKTSEGILETIVILDLPGKRKGIDNQRTPNVQHLLAGPALHESFFACSSAPPERSHGRSRYLLRRRQHGSRCGPASVVDEHRSGRSVRACSRTRRLFPRSQPGCPRRSQGFGVRQTTDGSI